MLAHAILFQYQRTYIYHAHVVVELASSKQASKHASKQQSASSILLELPAFIQMQVYS
jgi:hypothetical protein